MVCDSFCPQDPVLQSVKAQDPGDPHHKVAANVLGLMASAEDTRCRSCLLKMHDQVGKWPGGKTGQKVTDTSEDSGSLWFFSDFPTDLS